jgi:hypothetical protein
MNQVPHFHPPFTLGPHPLGAKTAGHQRRPNLLNGKFRIEAINIK